LSFAKALHGDRGDLSGRVRPKYIEVFILEP
jgi:hypothetical protein